MGTGRRRLFGESERVNPVQNIHVWRSPAGAGVDLQIVTHLDVYSSIHEHSVKALPDETGGFLLGKVGQDAGDGSWYLEIDEAIPIEPAERNPAHFTFTWKDVDRVRNYREEQGKALLGWYHTHPDLGIFLSETDLEKTHRVLFSEPFQIALVYDPVRQRAGYFFWEGSQMIEAGSAEWREFQIEVAREAPARNLQEDVSAGRIERTTDPRFKPEVGEIPETQSESPPQRLDEQPEERVQTSEEKTSPPSPSLQAQWMDGERAGPGEGKSNTFRPFLFGVILGIAIVVIAFIGFWLGAKFGR